MNFQVGNFRLGGSCIALFAIVIEISDENYDMQIILDVGSSGMVVDSATDISVVKVKGAKMWKKK